MMSVLVIQAIHFTGKHASAYSLKKVMRSRHACRYGWVGDGNTETRYSVHRGIRVSMFIKEAYRFHTCLHVWVTRYWREFYECAHTTLNELFFLTFLTSGVSYGHFTPNYRSSTSCMMYLDNSSHRKYAHVFTNYTASCSMNKLTPASLL